MDTVSQCRQAASRTECESILSRLSVAQLKALAAEHGWTVRGTKAQMVRDLTEVTHGRLADSLAISRVMGY